MQYKIHTMQRRELELRGASYKLAKDRKSRQREQDTAFANEILHSAYGSAAVLTSVLARGCVSLMPAMCASAVLITEL